jgi:hypothetical protein
MALQLAASPAANKTHAEMASEIARLRARVDEHESDNRVRLCQLGANMYIVKQTTARCALHRVSLSADCTELQWRAVKGNRNTVKIKTIDVSSILGIVYGRKTKRFARALQQRKNRSVFDACPPWHSLSILTPFKTVDVLLLDEALIVPWVLCLQALQHTPMLLWTRGSLVAHRGWMKLRAFASETSVTPTQYVAAHLMRIARHRRAERLRRARSLWRPPFAAHLVRWSGLATTLRRPACPGDDAAADADADADDADAATSSTPSSSLIALQEGQSGDLASLKTTTAAVASDNDGDEEAVDDRGVDSEFNGMPAGDGAFSCASSDIAALHAYIDELSRSMQARDLTTTPMSPTQPLISSGVAVAPSTPLSKGVNENTMELSNRGMRTPMSTSLSPPPMPRVASPELRRIVAGMRDLVVNTRRLRAFDANDTLDNDGDHSDRVDVDCAVSASAFDASENTGTAGHPT